MAVLLTGREPADSIRSDVRERASALDGRATCLAVLVVGEDPSSAVYVASKEKACARAGFESRVLRFGAGEAEETVLARISELNADPAVDGILCQLPVPPHISPARVAAAIDPRKDVDGFHPFNVGRLWRGERTIVPCTPLGVMRMLGFYGLRVSGQRAVVLGRSNIVGKPMAALLLKEDATVTLAHSRTPDLPGLCSQADILVTATGIPGMVGPSFVKPGAIVIDVGITRTPGGLKGDVLFEEVEPACGWITPVPGGVGLLTIAMLLSNTLDCRLALQGGAGTTS